MTILRVEFQNFGDINNITKQCMINNNKYCCAYIINILDDQQGYSSQTSEWMDFEDILSNGH